jgi:hypothetical protein
MPEQTLFTSCLQEVTIKMALYINTQRDLLSLQRRAALSKRSSIPITVHAASVFERALARIMTVGSIDRQEVLQLCGSDIAPFAALARCDSATARGRLSAHFIIPALDIIWIAISDKGIVDIDRANLLFCQHLSRYVPKWPIKATPRLFKSRKGFPVIKVNRSGD